MIIKLYGETSLNKLPKILREVITDIQGRAGIEESKFTLKDLEVGILFNVNGEKMMLSSEIEGIVEPFKVFVELDEKGNIKNKKDNEEETFQDDYTRAIAKGLENPLNKEIDSVYNDKDLEFDFEEVGGDLVAKYYTVKETGDKVVRYYRSGVLVGEIGLKK